MWSSSGTPPQRRANARVAPATPCRLLLAGMLLTLLAGCASTRAPVPTLPADAQEALLRGLAGFSLNGRTVVKAGGDGFTGSLSWTQQQQQTELRITGPIGVGGLSVTWRPDLLRITRGETYEGAAAGQVLLEQLGFMPPFEALPYWVLGLEAPGEAASGRTPPAETGRLGGLVQQQWTIRYERWMTVTLRGAAVQLPKRVVVTRDDLQLTVFVDRWKL